MPDNIETKVNFVVEGDNYPDTSYLEQADFGDRLGAYQRGEFNFCGVYAAVESHNWTTGVTVKMRSAGLWGIEDDSGEDYFLEVGREELAQLADDAAKLGIFVWEQEPELRYV